MGKILRVDLSTGSMRDENLPEEPVLRKFIGGQALAWRQLQSAGVFLATNPSSSFFYVLTAAHALHVLGGLGGLLRVIYKLNNFSLRRSTLDVASQYWHFMDVLWIYLLLLLWTRI